MLTENNLLKIKTNNTSKSPPFLLHGRFSDTDHARQTPQIVPVQKWPLGPMAALRIGEKCSYTPSTLRFFASLRLAHEPKISFLDGH